MMYTVEVVDNHDRIGLRIAVPSSNCSVMVTVQHFSPCQSNIVELKSGLITLLENLSQRLLQ